MEEYRVVLFNDTRIEENPGCHATVDSLLKFVKENINAKNISINTFPVGAECSSFSNPNLYKKKKKSFLFKLFSRFLSKFKTHIYSHSNIDVNLWKKIALNDLSFEIKESINNSNLIIVNMEGTIHHNNLGTFALLGIAFYCKSLGKKIAMVNGSYQDIDPKLTRLALGEIDFISVREPISYRYLEKEINKVFLIPDFAFRAPIHSRINEFVGGGGKKCLYTPGVLGVYPNQKGGVSINMIFNHIKNIKKMGYTPYFLMIEPKESFIVIELERIGVKIIPAYGDGVSYKNIGTLISEFDLLITGRYHIGIFGLMSFVKTIFLPSNTHKIEGVLEFLNMHEIIIKNNDFDCVSSIINNYKFPVLKKNTFKNEYNVLKEFLINLSNENNG